MTTRQTRIRVGVFATGALGLLAFVLVAFGAFRVLEHHNYYTIEFPDSVLGLDSGASVYFDGIEVGTVNDIAVSPDDLAKVRVEIAVKRDAPVHADTLAYISMTGFTGLKTIDLKGGTAGSPLLASDGQLKAGQSTIDRLEAQAEQLVDASSIVLARAKKIADNAQQVTDNLVAATDPKPIAAITAQALQAATSLAGSSKEVEAMLAENRAALKQSLASLATASRGASDVIAEVHGVVDGGAGQIQAMLGDLRQASRSFKELAREVRDKPSRLLYSNAPSDRRLP